LRHLFTGIASGLNLVNLNQLAAGSLQEDREIGLGYLKQKKQIIEGEAVGLLKFIAPKGGSCIGCRSNRGQPDAAAQWPPQGSGSGCRP
jgi:hypothetical protein